MYKSLQIAALIASIATALDLEITNGGEFPELY